MAKTSVPPDENIPLLLCLLSFLMHHMLFPALMQYVWGKQFRRTQFIKADTYKEGH